MLRNADIAMATHCICHYTLMNLSIYTSSALEGVHRRHFVSKTCLPKAIGNVLESNRITIKLAIYLLAIYLLRLSCKCDQTHMESQY